MTDIEETSPTSPLHAVLGAIGYVVLPLLAVSTLAIAQPTFDLIGSEATFLVAHGSTARETVTFAFVVFLVPVVVGSAIVGAAWLVRPAAGRMTLAVFVGGLGAIGALQVVPAAWIEGTVVHVALFVLLGMAIGVSFHRYELAGTFARALGWISPVILAVFLFGSEATDVIFADEVGAVGSGAAAAGSADVIVVVFDELGLSVMVNDDLEIDEGRFPNFARLADQSTWYENTTSISVKTKWAVPAILAGSLDDSGPLPIAAEFPQNLFTVTAASHRVVADELVTRLCPPSICGEPVSVVATPSLYRDARIAYLHRVLPDAWAADWLPAIDDRWTGFGDDGGGDGGGGDGGGDEDTLEIADDPAAALTERTRADLGLNDRERWRAFVDGLDERDGPTISYHHSGLPHKPYVLLAGGERYDRLGPTPGLGLFNWNEQPGAVENSIRRYSQQARAVDLMIGELLDRLEQDPRFADTLLVVTADHGVAHVPGLPRREIHPATIADLVRVPLFVKYPGQVEGVRDPRPAQTTDILATIADVLSIDLEEPTSGRSLRADWSTADRWVFEWPEDVDFEASFDFRRAVDTVAAVVPNGDAARGGFAGVGGVDYGGRSTTSFATADPVDGVVRTESDLLGEVSFGGRLPVVFIASVEGVDAGSDVLIALNGQVAGASTVDAVDGGFEFHALLDPSTMVEGDNRLEVFVLEDEVLAPIEVAGG